jgi:hypothetical protein
MVSQHWLEFSIKFKLTETQRNLTEQLWLLGVWFPKDLGPYLMEGSSHCGWSPTTLAARHGTTANGRANRRRKVFCLKKHSWRLWTASFLSAKFYEWNRKSSMQFLKFLILGKRRIPSWLPYIILQILRLFNLQTTFSIIQSFGVQLGTLLLPSEKGNGTEHKSRGKNSLGYLVTKR